MKFLVLLFLIYHKKIMRNDTKLFSYNSEKSNTLKSKGISKVMLTAPGKGDLPNIVYGVNHEQQDIINEKIFTAASCTTNAIVPILKVIFRFHLGGLTIVYLIKKNHLDQ